ncbi:MAG: peptidoglycan-binding protein [Rhodobacteraceae bacterium]|nr:peptidoglycan-binding protein [Paracoccaceae bacterium]
MQIALRWGGYYNAAIDGAYGSGTRQAMAAWQADNGYDQTGMLTTHQHRDLTGQYNAPLISVGMRTYRDARADLELQLLLEAVQFDRYGAPFVHFQGTSSVPDAQVLLISQDGTRGMLFGL